MNSKRKGSGGERELARILSEHGHGSHRNEQRHVGGLENPDITLEGYHVEVKRTERLQLYPALEQAIRDANGKAIPMVMHRKNRAPWVVIMRLEDWLTIK